MNLTGTVVDFASHHRQIFRIGGDFHTFGKELSDDAVEVLVAAAFPRRVGVGEEHRQPGRGDGGVAGLSEPRSQVNDRRIWAGSPSVAAMTASPTLSESRPVKGTRMRNREIRSTSVATAVLPSLPMIKSPSQCPGTARASTSAGRSSM